MHINSKKAVINFNLVTKLNQISEYPTSHSMIWFQISVMQRSTSNSNKKGQDFICFHDWSCRVLKCDSNIQ